MRLQDQVSNVELSNKLKKLGVVKPSLFFRDWTGAKEDAIEMNEKPEFNLDNVNCYSVAELGEMLPDHTPSDKERGEWYIFIGGHSPAKAKTEANARAKMLIYLIENGLIKI
ncbi:MAG TPA: hypothetical protein ENH85_00465 [Candidatus Scalindua sp.]|nr:hypothetical protein [Candidatus Scalindua sp.]